MRRKPVSFLMDLSDSMPGGFIGETQAGPELLMSRINRDVAKTARERKGDWKPIVFLFTDGAPPDSPSAAAQRWQKHNKNRANHVVATSGPNPAADMFAQITNNALTLTALYKDSFHDFFHKVRASIKVSSKADESSGDGVSLAGRPINLEKAMKATSIDDGCACLAAKYSSTGRLWLAKYARDGAKCRRPEGSWPVDEKSHKSPSAEERAGSINLADIDRITKCPECGGENGAIKCACGSLICPPKAPGMRCPWGGLTYGKIHLVDSLDAARGWG